MYFLFSYTYITYHYLDIKKLALNPKQTKVLVAKKGGRSDKFEIKKGKGE